jgi:hypothetical protein
MLHCPTLKLSGGHHNLLSGSIILVLSAKEIAAENLIWGCFQYLKNLL